MKFQGLLEIELKDIDVPDYGWVTYSVCGITPEACGCQDWILESLFKGDGITRSASGGSGKILSMDNTEQLCPRCGRKLFRTRASLRLVPSVDQAPPQGEQELDYDTVPSGL
jgi:hypothetical protein